MKLASLLRGSLLISASLALVSTLSAQDGDDPVLSNLDPTPMTMDTLDLNRDGNVSEDEFTAFHMERIKKYFAMLDANGDQQLQSKEVMKETEARKKIQLETLQTLVPDMGRNRPNITDIKPTAGARGPSGPASRRINR